jgi:excisionase family DNA binding protein
MGICLLRSSPSGPPRVPMGDMTLTSTDPLLPPAPAGLLDIETLALRLGVTVRFVRRLVEERRVPYFKLGKLVTLPA